LNKKANPQIGNTACQPPFAIFCGRAPEERVQFLVKQSRKYALTGGWGFAQFNDGKPADEAVHKNLPCATNPQNSRLCLHPLRTLSASDGVQIREQKKEQQS
jgi:hypothetical protein